MPVEIKPRKSRPVASKQQFRDEIISLRRIGGQLLDLADKALDQRLKTGDHDRVMLGALRERWGAIKRSEGL